MLRATLASLVLGLSLGAAPSLAQPSYLLFESGPVRPLALSPDGSRLFAVNTPDNRLEIFDVDAAGLAHAGSVPVGMEPVAVAARSDAEVWVVNHLSDSVSIVDVAASPPRVVRTLLVGDEPRDIVFAGTQAARAFISAAHRGQHRTHPSIAGVPGAGSPQLTTPGIGRADVWVFDAASPGAALGGTPVKILSFFADTPRGLAVSPDGGTVYVAAHRSGNQTASIPEALVCDGFQGDTACTAPQPLPLLGITSLPGGQQGPAQNDPPGNDPPTPAPETGLIVKFDGSAWRSSSGTDWSSFLRFDLPDHDVFAVSADTLDDAAASAWDQVGTVLFNLAVNPVSGKVYASNTESPNHVRFEGPGVHGGSTVQGHLSEARISVLSGAGAVAVRHLNKHIEYTKLHTDVPDLVDPTQKEYSLATPLQMAISSDGATLYVAAFGSARVGVFSTAALEADTFDPTETSPDAIPTGGGPGGLVLDEGRGRLYVWTRFDNAVAAIDLASRATLQTAALYSPEPPSVVEGRPFLYDAFATSGNGEASCASCHIFGDLDDLAWDLGDPDAATSINNQPSPTNTAAATFHPMKGPMTTQTLRGLSTHGAMHWRGDRLDGFFGTDACDPKCDEEHSFLNFIVAFEGLLGKDGVLDPGDMQKFTDFALQLRLPPNPVRALSNQLAAVQANGLAHYNRPGVDGAGSCSACHRLDPGSGFFGTDSGQVAEGGTQNFKIPHLRNAYAKVGMFGMRVEPDGFQPPHRGDQIRGFGFNHAGNVDTLGNFVSAVVFQNLTPSEEAELEQFMLAFPTDLAPIVGQQVTRDAANGAAVDPRISLLNLRAAASFDSLVLGGTVSECEVVVKGVVGGQPRGWVRLPSGLYQDDKGSLLSDASLRALSASEGPLTYTCAPPGSGVRMGIDRDEDAVLDGLDNCGAASNADQADGDGEGAGDACDNCQLAGNAAQVDSDHDGFGNGCDADYDNDGAVAGTDFFALLGALGTSLGEAGYDPDADSDADDAVGGADFFFFLGELGGTPGP